jgi:hypothetical protein
LAETRQPLPGHGGREAASEIDLGATGRPAPAPYPNVSALTEPRHFGAEPHRRFDAIRYFTLAAVLAATLISAAPALARAETPDALRSVNHAVSLTHYWQAKGGFCCKRYWYVAHRHSTPTWKRWHIAAIWWGNAAQAHARYMAMPHYAWPDSLTAAFRCISLHEEYGFPDVGGHNSPAGYFGMPSPPSAYPGSAAAVARFGNSWLAIPFDWQDEIAYAELLKYGWYPTWSTAPGCGLT